MARGARIHHPPGVLESHLVERSNQPGLVPGGAWLGHLQQGEGHVGLRSWAEEARGAPAPTRAGLGPCDVAQEGLKQIHGPVG